jgi:alpha-ketoglutarate-dependent taurine dioxygenase
MIPRSLASDESLRTTPLEPFGLMLEPSRPNAEVAAISLEGMREAIITHRLLLLRGFSPFDSKEQLANYGSLWGPLLEWDFGTVFEVAQKEQPRNYLFTSGNVPYHWDGAFADQEPWLQIFQCQESPGMDTGGETLFCDTTRLWNEAPPERQDQWQGVEIEYESDKVAHYGGKIRVPLLGKHPRTGKTVLRFAEPADAGTAPLNTPELRVFGIPEEAVADFLGDFKERIYAPQHVYAHSWNAGDRLIADNHVLLHGRRSYRNSQPRRLWRVHVL